MTTSWADFVAAEPTLAQLVEQRFGRFNHHVLGTLRADGAPRLSGLEVDFREGDLWLGMMPGSRKAADLLRDPRFALHANPGASSDMDGGDVRVSGRAVPATDSEFRWYARQAGEEVPEVFALFKADVTEVVRVTIEVPDMVIRTWRPEAGLRTLRRGNDDTPVREDP
ncbi:pyridoxamine 5'-phosphate oxidase family protein [Streptomyces sp. NPDC005438]|uniref:pyridoxamine 5'-phosphate oxidase family protein n=1 Tax=Streptomyces sp. NPDC005438 TaxID=3156880 RepID=UPI0033ABC29A